MKHLLITIAVTYLGISCSVSLFLVACMMLFSRRSSEPPPDQRQEKKKSDS